MYKLLLVDDERIIREGIMQLVDWNSLGIEVDEAANGLEAYEKIQKNNTPNIVITDIKMPGMDGLELIDKVKAEFPDILFVILSGYGEFDFASRAMKYGVKHYLLKPCDEEEIIKIMNNVVSELNQRKLRRDFVKKMKKDLEKVMPQIKEQFLRDCVMNRLIDEDDANYFKNLLKLPVAKMRLLLFHLEGIHGFEKRFALKNLLDHWKEDPPLLSTVIGENVLALQKAILPEMLFSYLEDVKCCFYAYYGISFTVAVSPEGFFEQLPALYGEVTQYLEYRFYLGEGSVITGDDVGNRGHLSQRAANFDSLRLELLIRSGNVNAVRKEIETFFSELNSDKCKLDIMRTSCMELYISVIRQGKPQNLKEYMRRILELQQINTLDRMFVFITSVAREITETNYKENVQKNSRVIRTVLNVMKENISADDLSLCWIAKNIVYMNVDYLSKLFKKEIGENFSKYLINMRIEKAKELLAEDSHSKISEIADQVGYGNNPQYFGQVFKKATGYTPSEYKKMLEC